MKVSIIMGISVYGGVDPDSIKVTSSTSGATRIVSNMKKKYLNVIRIDRDLKNIDKNRYKLIHN